MDVGTCNPACGGNAVPHSRPVHRPGSMRLLGTSSPIHIEHGGCYPAAEDANTGPCQWSRRTRRGRTTPRVAFSGRYPGLVPYEPFGQKEHLER
ncbi:hypothetical protein GCM10009602_09480 [Nocardiopsis tropica]